MDRHINRTGAPRPAAQAPRESRPCRPALERGRRAPYAARPAASHASDSENLEAFLPTYPAALQETHDVGGGDITSRLACPSPSPGSQPRASDPGGRSPQPRRLDSPSSWSSLDATCGCKRIARQYACWLGSRRPSAPAAGAGAHSESTSGDATLFISEAPAPRSASRRRGSRRFKAGAPLIRVAVISCEVALARGQTHIHSTGSQRYPLYV